ncbi:hypothetical protein S40285_09848 [Stachybotrys chlorohalonatus IBT 40285]|uniref:Ubiquitin 3 binding protein But2 C-terminal domain-containing protein n=1 Tax=Stachybotrys chlorohalonatus (strain IBT 40285) TaxID=1283841 RepID=A0A084QNF4_STAC4|nr:hypothetical protein S40285_09848 [Stachybotrys chlorohalonata IBT 40285]
MRLTAIILTLAGSALALPVAEPIEPAFTAVTHSGSGCPQDTSVESIDGGKSYKIHGFSSRAPGPDTTQNCALHLNAGGQSKLQLSLKHATVRAHGYFPSGAGLTYYLTNFWTSQPANTGTTTGTWTNSGGTINGPLVVEIEVPADERVWSKCGETDIMNPNFRVVLQDTGYYGTRNSLVTTETLTYVWREC